MIGGEIVKITDAYGAPKLGPSKHDPDGEWFDHYGVLKDGRFTMASQARRECPLMSTVASGNTGNTLTLNRESSSE
jgi:hypothetical protein